MSGFLHRMRGGLKLIEDELRKFFEVYHVEVENGVTRYYVIPKSVDSQEIQYFFQSLSQDYDIKFKRHYGELVVEIKKRKESHTINIILFVLTFISVTIAGSTFYGEINILQGIQFALAVMFVLGSHEMGHFFASKRWGMRASLPYFIPFPTIIGTLGAIIKQRGVIKNRKALLEIGAAGPLTGVVASVIITYIGLKMNVQPPKIEGVLMIGTPPLFDFVAKLADFKGEYIHPVAFAGWVGMFVTALNIIPVGQLDGGHIMRALIGEKAEIVSRTFPFALITLAYLYPESGIWLFWGFVAIILSMQRHPKPMDDSPLPLGYILLGVLTYIVGLLCFTPTPFIIPKNI